MDTNSNASSRIILVLASIPTADCVLNQIVNGLHLNLGSVSVLQIFRALLLIFFAGFAISKAHKNPDIIKRIPLPAFAALALLLLWLSKQWLFGGGAGAVSFMAYAQYGQITYWIILWITASLVCVTTAQAMLLLYGLAAGALLTGSSVLFGLGFGGINFYEDDLVSSSAGWFNTAKTITGILVCGVIVILYLGCGRRRSWVYATLAAVCLVGVMLTYARAGAVALVVVILWFAIWAGHAGGFFQWSALKLFFAFAMLIAVAAPLAIRPQTLFARWSDMSQGENAGSGRAGLWKIAMETFSAASPSDQLLGNGFDAMADILYRECGEDVKHTHNDTFDLLLIGGVVGILWQVSFIWSWGARIVHFSLWSLEGAAAVAIFIDYFCHAQLTGQLWGTDVMNYYLFGLTALNVIGHQQRLISQTRPRPFSFTFNHSTSSGFAG